MFEESIYYIKYTKLPCIFYIYKFEIKGHPLTIK